MKNDDTIILRIMDQNEENELLRITKIPMPLPVKSWGMLIFNKDRPDILKPHPQNYARHDIEDIAKS